MAELIFTRENLAAHAAERDVLRNGIADVLQTLYADIAAGQTTVNPNVIAASLHDIQTRAGEAYWAAIGDKPGGAKLLPHPGMIDGYYLVATDKDDNGLYAYRNWRMGGRSYKVRLVSGVVKQWGDYAVGSGRARPNPPPAGGRWKWKDTETREAFA